MKLADTPWTPAWRRYCLARLPNTKIPAPKPEPAMRIAPPAVRTCQPPRQLSTRIVHLCAEACRVPVASVIAGSHCKAKGVMRARKAAAFLIRRHTSHTFTLIAKRLGINHVH